MERAGIDRLAALRSSIGAVRRGGTVSVSGVYGGMADPMPMMEIFDKQAHPAVRAVQRQAVGRRHRARRHGGRRPVGPRVPGDAPAPPRLGPRCLRDVPGQGGRLHQGGAQPVSGVALVAGASRGLGLLISAEPGVARLPRARVRPRPGRGSTARRTCSPPSGSVSSCRRPRATDRSGRSSGRSATSPTRTPSLRGSRACAPAKVLWTWRSTSPGSSRSARSSRPPWATSAPPSTRCSSGRSTCASRCCRRCSRPATGASGSSGSVGGVVAVPHLLPYSVAKFGAVGLSEGLQAEPEWHGGHRDDHRPGPHAHGRSRPRSVRRGRSEGLRLVRAGRLDAPALGVRRAGRPPDRRGRARGPVAGRASPRSRGSDGGCTGSRRASPPACSGSWPGRCHAVMTVHHR